STCNRTSLFFDLDLKESIQEFNFYNILVDFDINDILNKLNLNYLKDYLVVKKGLEAVENLLRIACGLESQVFGETDIIKQVKQYYYYSKENNLLSPFLEILINKILHYSKEFDINIRSRFNYLKNSFASFIVNFIKKNHNQKKINLLFIGLGNVSKQILKLLINDTSFFDKINEIFIVSNYHHYFRQNLSFNLNIYFFEKDKLNLAFDKIKNKVDLIIVNSKNFFLSYDYLKDISKDVIIFDLCLPRGVDPYISNLSNFTLIDLDKLKKINIYEDLLTNFDDLIEIIESFIKSKVKEFYEYIISRTLDKRLINFYQEMYNIKKELLEQSRIKNQTSIDLLDKYIKKTIYRISKTHKDFLGLKDKTGIFKKQLILGTRGSKLALIQTKKVLNLLENFFPDFDFFIKTIKTSGDKKNYTNNSFVKEIEEALVKEEIDIAVNSLKDMPYFINLNTNIAAVLNREDVNDILISKDNKSFWELPKGSIIGTSSLRRKEQLKILRNDLIFKDITGNVDTRIKKT
ncbi:MAG: hydroxymethylbilane synthase, partial [bacterium]